MSNSWTLVSPLSLRSVPSPSLGFQTGRLALLVLPGPFLHSRNLPNASLESALQSQGLEVSPRAQTCSQLGKAKSGGEIAPLFHSTWQAAVLHRGDARSPGGVGG